MNEVDSYTKYLQSEELADSTICTYIKEMKKLLAFMGNGSISKEQVIKFKTMMMQKYS